MIRCAVAGLGWVGSRHVEAIRELNSKVSVECLVDTDEEHLRRVSEEHQVEKAYTRIGNALADEDVDAVSIGTPDALHREQAAEAVRAGKHVLCEKPMVLTVEDVSRMIEAAEAEA